MIERKNGERENSEQKSEKKVKEKTSIRQIAKSE